jgi:hypothetical protein
VTRAIDVPARARHAAKSELRLRRKREPVVLRPDNGQIRKQSIVGSEEARVKR